MKSIDIEIPEPVNLLPFDGEVHYFGRVMNDALASEFFKTLFAGIDWQHDEAIMFGRKIITKRKVAWYGNESFKYTYSKVTKLALPWTDELLMLKTMVEEISQENYNSCLLNLYHNGSEGMAWHSDDEATLKKDGAIASISLGAERKFMFKHKRTGEVVAINLWPGSLIIMKEDTQRHWLHRLPPTKKVRDARINLTFRTIVGQ